MKWKDKYNGKYMQISLYVIITSIIIYALSRIVENAPAIMREIMERIGWVIKVIKPLILGFAFAYLLDPIVSFFESKFKKYKIFKWIKTPRTFAAILSAILLVMAFSGLISLLVFSVTDQLRLANFDDIVRLSEEYMNSLNELYDSIITKMKELDIQSDEFEKYVQDATQLILNTLMNFSKSTITSISNISGYLTTFIFSFIIGFYFLIDGRLFMEYVRKISVALFPESANKRMRKTIHDLDRVFSGYIRGQLTDAFVMMVLISLVLSITGVKFAIVIGIFAGIGNLIPYFGPIVAYISTTIVCLINGDIKTLLISLIALAVIQFIDGNLIGPKLLSKSIEIHPLIVIISLIFGSALGGFLGMLLAVPVGAYIKLVFARFINHRYDRKEATKKEMPMKEYKKE
ncbi:AI-2E family transporter [Mobilitalea sibirica]|uniref:AI-2E family transporter n=1 Tax=Mobilitalea sibirica TaxID=1462919 RepID=A0A8J7H5M6_9FIRM|nr:AI-2E family transporter [Mobilitalea sibirica]MBH1941699.1 AI-2E family transporter [Mobilitalea sibirica]